MSRTAALLETARALYRPAPDADQLLELEISAACERMTAHLAAGRLEAARAAEQRMRVLIAQRSPARVMEMERERGLMR